MIRPVTTFQTVNPISGPLISACGRSAAGSEDYWFCPDNVSSATDTPQQLAPRRPGSNSTEIPAPTTHRSLMFLLQLRRCRHLERRMHQQTGYSPGQRSPSKCFTRGRSQPHNNRHSVRLQRHNNRHSVGGHSSMAWEDNATVLITTWQHSVVHFILFHLPLKSSYSAALLL